MKLTLAGRPIVSLVVAAILVVQERSALLCETRRAPLRSSEELGISKEESELASPNLTTIRAKSTQTVLIH